jgi:Ca2+-binding RTX toxin-like protein
VVRGTSGDDVLLGSPRSQMILGRAGNDHVCAGDGNDTVLGQAGDDTIHGEGRGDTLFGGGGTDRIYGDILDDDLYGGPAPDLLIGGHGVDAMYGGAGNDLLRGGTNRDCLYGQGGSNAASFATATPPGPPGSGIAGVRVDLNDPTKGECPRGGGGRADGDGDGEVLKDIQFVVGSAFGDSIRGRPGAGVDAGLGDDSCPDFGPGQAGCGGGDEKPAGTFAYIFESNTGTQPDPGLIVRAPQGVPDETISVSGSGGTVAVAVAGGALAAGPHCTSQGGSVASCAPATGPLSYVMVYGEDNADTINIGAGLPPDATVDADGGPGDDTLNGSGAGEVLFGGDSAGSDALNGGGGGDALISEGGDRASGPDLLSGGPDSDQLVTDYPCAGHTFSGGAGTDVAGFARSTLGVRARLGGRATLAGGGCAAGSPTRILLDSEILEGTNLADRLTGSRKGETIWGRGGGDLLVGKAGADLLEGFGGADLIDARDHRRDRRIDCGGGADRGARRDRADPRAISC